MSWQPIETAPKDGTYFDAWFVLENGHGCRFANCSYHYYSDGWRIIGRPSVGWKATHWMPLPSPPDETPGLAGDAVRQDETG